MGLTSYDIQQASEKIKRLRTSSSTPIQWRKPIQLFGREDESVKSTYKNLCEIPDKDWNMRSGVVSEILQLFSKHVKDKMEKAQEKYGEIILQDFCPLGSSREGLKVKAPDEFDVLMPFSFRDQNIKVLTTSENTEIPPGHAEIHVTGGPGEWFDKYRMVNSRGVLLSRCVHERYFRGLIEGAKSTIATLIEQERRDDIVFRITMTTNPPAITIHITVEYTSRIQPSQFLYDVRLQAASESREAFNIDVDIVPGILMESASYADSRTCSMYLVTRWFHESQNDDPSLQDHLDTLWRISHSDYEIAILDNCRVGTSQERYIITAARIIKGLQKNQGVHCPSDQFSSVFKSYYLKTILLYTLLYFTKISQTPISGVTEALACYIGMFRVSLKKRKLPHFFLANPNLDQIYPGRQSKGMSHRMNLFEGIEVSLPSVSKSLNEALKDASIEVKGDTVLLYQKLFNSFEKHIDK